MSATEDNINLKQRKSFFIRLINYFSDEQPRDRISQNKIIYRPKFKWEIGQIYKLFLYLGLLFVLIWNLPNSVWNPDFKIWIILFGSLGVWRYTWWITHFVRSLFYNQIKFTKIRYQCGKLLDSGWRPNKVVFMITAYNESESVLEHMLSSVNREAELIKVPFEVYIATADYKIEEKIRKVWRWLNISKHIKLNIVRQGLPGKRMAIGSALRCISRQGLGNNDPVVFMDGDTALTPGAVLKSIPIFYLKKDVHALTTHEKSKIKIPLWLIHWFNLRFTQRHMIMQSHALSNKVLTLTGRMSIFRGKIVLDERFISLVENDHLKHWLWGDFKFLSGDDKSTWYALLKIGAKMLYVPDALVYTIEEVHETAMHRLKENMLRWSGNILRNGWRGIMLGPKRVGLFPWWCLVDQRIIMFSMMVAPFLVVSGSILVSWSFIPIYIIWVLFSRLCLACALFYHNRKMDMTFPFVLYLNQFVTAMFKIYLLFRLPMQKWANRGDQMLPIEGSSKLNMLRKIMAIYMTLLMLAAILLVTLTYTELLPMLSIIDIDSWIY